MLRAVDFQGDFPRAHLIEERLTADLMPRRQSTVPGMLIAVLLAFLLVSTAFGKEAAIRGKCVGVHDGDCCTLLVSGNTQIKIRVAFLDAPELGQPFGYRAKQAMSNLLFGKSVVVRPGRCRVRRRNGCRPANAPARTRLVLRSLSA